jgi:hypothetical protein
MRASTLVCRFGVVVVALILSLGSAGTQKKRRGATKTATETLVYESRPTFTWKAEKGAVYRLQLYRVPSPPALRTVAYDAHEVAGGSWTVPIDLELGIRYELFLTLDRNVRVLTSWGFTVGMEKPSLASPAADAPLMTLMPELRIAALAYSDVVFGIELAGDASFASPLGQAQLAQPKGAAYVAWSPPLLQAGTTYHWRLRAYHFKHGTLTPGAALPELARAIGTTETVGSFAVASQPGIDALTGLTWIMNEPAGAAMPAISPKKLDLAYVVETGDGGATIRIAPNAPKAKVPTYGETREDLTASVNGSRDLHPIWDVDGKGLFFDSNRAQGVRNIWLKTRDSSGYTQITFHDRDASHPSLAKDGKHLVYQVAGATPTVWIADRDGRNGRELGAGEAPRFSPDGTRVAFALRDEGGTRHLWIMDATGENRTQVTTGGDDDQPVWTADGKNLVFVSSRAGNDDLWQISSLGGEPLQLTTYLGRDTTPALASDGKRVLFASQRGGVSLGVWLGVLPPPVAPAP